MKTILKIVFNFIRNWFEIEQKYRTISCQICSIWLELSVDG